MNKWPWHLQWMLMDSVECFQFQLYPKRKRRTYGYGKEAPDGEIFLKSPPNQSVATMGPSAWIFWEVRHSREGRVSLDHSISSQKERYSWDGFLWKIKPFIWPVMKLRPRQDNWVEILSVIIRPNSIQVTPSDLVRYHFACGTALKINTSS